MLRRTLFASLVAVTLVPTAVLAAPEDPVGEVVHRLNKIKTIYDLKMNPEIRYQIIPEVQPEFDSLLGYMAEKFTEIPSTELVGEWLRTKRSANLEEYFRAMPTTVVPIMAAKLALGGWKIVIHAKDLTNWRQFVESYSKCLPGA